MMVDAGMELWCCFWVFEGVIGGVGFSSCYVCRWMRSRRAILWSRVEERAGVG